jgi:prepilin-type N-terminal cleavage/methylation domain-containing protein
MKDLKTTHRLSKTNKHGFTLLELMIAVAITAILSAIAIPSFSNLIESHKVSSMSSDLYSEYSRAKSAAFSNNRTVAICASSDGESCDASTIDTLGQQNFSDGFISYIPSLNTAATGISPEALIGVFQADGVDIQFHAATDLAINARGMSNTGKFVICYYNLSNEDAVQLNITAAGQVIQDDLESGQSCG